MSQYTNKSQLKKTITQYFKSIIKAVLGERANIHTNHNLRKQSHDITGLRLKRCLASELIYIIPQYDKIGAERVHGHYEDHYNNVRFPTL